MIIVLASLFYLTDLLLRCKPRKVHFFLPSESSFADSVECNIEEVSSVKSSSKRGYNLSRSLNLIAFIYCLAWILKSEANREKFTAN